MRRDLHSVRVLYFCTWCDRTGWELREKEEFKHLGGPWYDNVCLKCREEEAAGVSMMEIRTRRNSPKRGESNDRESDLGSEVLPCER